PRYVASALGRGQGTEAHHEHPQRWANGGKVGRAKFGGVSGVERSRTARAPPRSVLLVAVLAAVPRRSHRPVPVGRATRADPPRGLWRGRRGGGRNASRPPPGDRGAGRDGPLPASQPAVRRRRGGPRVRRPPPEGTPRIGPVRRAGGGGAPALVGAGPRST